MPPKILCDENFNFEVTLALRRAGYDAIHVMEEDRRGLSDESQLQFAIEKERMLLTHDRADFEILHKSYLRRGWEHYGILICTPYDVRELVRRLVSFFKHSPESLSNSIWHI